MTIDKTINPWLGLAVEQSTTRPAKPNGTVKSDAGLKPSARPTSAAEFISVSPAAKGIIQAVRDTSQSGGHSSGDRRGAVPVGCRQTGAEVPRT